MSQNPRAQEVYRHFKGKLYQVITVATHSETREQLVIYQALYDDFKVYARPLAMFMERVDKIKYPNIAQEYRFELQDATQDDHLEMQDTIQAVEGTEKPQNQLEEPSLDPQLLEFLDADTYEAKINILVGLHHRITQSMINTMAVASDVEVPEGSLEERYEGLKNCLMTFQRYESRRLR